VEVAPAILPALLELAPIRIGEHGEDAIAGVAVRGQLDPVRMVDLLEALRCELDEAGPQVFGQVPGDTDRRADQRNALFSLSKKPSSGR
jgi:hypothetical protein